ncbi:MAG: SRPBCC domain-containing protein [Gemmatimonadales bacterium]
MSRPDAASATLVGQEITVTRTFEAPRDLVYQAWIDPKHLAAWWGPAGFTNPVCEVDARVGGKILIHMQGPDGAVYPMRGVFEELVAPERIVMLTSVDEADGRTRFEVRTTVTLAEAPGRTMLTVHAKVVTATADAAPQIAGMEPGWSQSVDRLQTHVAPGQPIKPKEMVTTRVLEAPPELVYQAWVKPERLAKWWGPNGFTNTIHQMDVRPGGAWRLTMHGPDGTDYPNDSVFLQVMPPRLLVYYHSSAPKFVSVVTFAPEGTGTKVTLLSHFLSDDGFDTAMKVYGAVEGAKQTLARLAEFVGRTAA